MYSKVLDIFNMPPADPVVYKWPLLGSPWPVLLIIFCYLIFVLKLGKIYMEHRQPYDLKKVLIVYNFCQMIYNFLMFSLASYMFIFYRPYDIRCMNKLPLDDPNKFDEQIIAYAYFVNKLIDLLDTIFFVLRKRYKQITFLHVYHHALMVIIIYLIIRFYGVGGQCSFVGFLNTFVHVVMYFYYLVSALNMGLGKSPRWKKYITLIQILQFTIFLLYSLYVFIFNRNCKFPLILQLILISQAVIFLNLFGRFYIDTYIRPKKRKNNKKTDVKST